MNNFANMNNPFKFGSVVDNDFFTDRINELSYIKGIMNSENHLILISPRRYGKSSLVLKCVKLISRPYIMLNLQSITDTNDFAVKILKAVFKLYPKEKLKHLIANFHFVPTITSDIQTGNIEVSFNPSANSTVMLEDAISLLENVSTKNKRLIVILDEFQEIVSIGKGLDKKMRAIMQLQKNINYIFLGSQESMMEQIFERKKSPFYHFGQLMRLGKIPQADFEEYLEKRLSPITKEYKEVISEIIQIAKCHPYYTQQLAFQIWDLAYREKISDNLVDTAINRILLLHDFDYERIWINFNKTDMRILQMVCVGENPLANRQIATSTSFSAIKRLMRNGYIIKDETYEIEDPFFRRWIINYTK